MAVNRTYEQGKIAFKSNPSAPNPYRQRTKRAMWWRRGWMDAEAAASEDWVDPNEYPRPKPAAFSGSIPDGITAMSMDTFLDIITGEGT